MADSVDYSLRAKWAFREAGVAPSRYFISKGGSTLEKRGDQARTGTEDILRWVMLSNRTWSLGRVLFKADHDADDEKRFLGVGHVAVWQAPPL